MKAEVKAAGGIAKPSASALPATEAEPFVVGPREPPYVPKDAPDLTKQRRLYVVNYAHLDTQWRWAFPLTVRQFLPDTVYRNVDYFVRYPSHIFNFTGASRYELLKEYYPELYRTVVNWVKEGRWFPAGNQWEECDVLVPSSESLLRQILHGRRYFQQAFGTESQEFLLPDSFGFPASLPSILNHAGLRGFSTQKLTWNSAVGIPFNVGRWQGTDGRGVIAALNAGNYGAVHRRSLSQSARWAQRLDDNAKEGGLKVDYLYNGSGDYGGAPHEISMVTLEASQRDSGPVKVVVDRADRMFSDISDEQAQKLPTYEGDLLLSEHSAGSLTSQAFIKRLNRLNELLANAAERASVTAAVLGANPYPETALGGAWRAVLRSQFHDVLGGTSIPEAYTYAWNDEFIAMNGFVYALTDAVAAVARGLDTRVEGVPLVVYNPLSRGRTDFVEAELPEELQNESEVTAFDGIGRALVTQLTRGRDGQRQVLFEASVPGDSFSVFALKATPSKPPDSELSVTERSLANGRYRIALNDQGDVSSIFDRAGNREVLREPLRLAFQTEHPSQFPAWNMDWIDRQRPPRGYVTGPSNFEVVESGPLRVALRSERTSEGSRFEQLVRLTSGSTKERIELRHRIDWKSQSCSLKASLRTTVENPNARYSWGIFPIERGNNRAEQFEVPTHSFIDLTDRNGQYGVTWLTGAKYGSDKPADDTLRLTLLYTPGVSEDYQDQRYQDWGRHDVVTALVGHVGPFRNEEAQFRVDAFEQPLLAFAVPKHAGALGKRYQLFFYDEANVALRTIKRSEDGRQIVLRFVELTGSPVRTKLRAALPLTAAWELTGVEKPIAPLPLAGDSLHLDFLPHQMRTIGVTLGPSQAIEATRSRPLPLPYNVDAMSENSDELDGNFDGKGHSYPAEMLPERLQVGGIEYELGPKRHGANNALLARGQVIDLPPNATSLHVLAAAVGAPQPGTFRFGTKRVSIEVGPNTGFLGQGDRPVFTGRVAPLSYSIEQPLNGVEPAYLRTDRLAWVISHQHQEKLGDVPFRHAYLYSYEIALDDRATNVTLPMDERLCIFALSVGFVDNARIRSLTSPWPDLRRDASFKERFESP